MILAQLAKVSEWSEKMVMEFRFWKEQETLIASHVSELMAEIMAQDDAA